MMLFDFATLPTQARYKLLTATITPRPIAWVVSQDADGVLNAAPFSFFNILSSAPPIIGIGIGNREGEDGMLKPKDSRANIIATGQFVVNLVSEDTVRAMNITAIDFPTGVDELVEAGLTTLPSVHIKPPRIAESPVALECELFQRVPLSETAELVLGRILALHVHDDAVIDAERHYINTPMLKLLGRMHGAGWYSRSSDLFELPRIAIDQWQRET
jgi:flavin reductase (DIM6/NTAB) family NADH-FMN oxidoreductase RutF